MIRRYSSRTEALDKDFLAKALDGASRYLRIAGYFRSSIFELVGEEISRIPEVKIVCNSELDAIDFQVASGRAMAIKERWNQVDVEAEALLQKERYVRLDQLLRGGNVEIRVVPRERLFLHGKAGSIHYPDGTRKAFIGSVNESKSAFAHNYELLWQDDEEAAAEWVEEEFWALWKDAVPLPEAILEEISRVARRQEVTVEALAPKALPGAVMAEAPIYRGGEQLQPWQRSFVTLFLEHREIYQRTRLLLADEVGVGKTLSMATSALVSVLLGDGPVVIFAPATLTLQWQVEMKDKLGIPTAVWSSLKKAWVGTEGQLLSPRGDFSQIGRCPHRIGIVSTGIITHQWDGDAFVREAGELLKSRFGLIVLDEAHKARSTFPPGNTDPKPNNLLIFMREIARRTKHLILGTATPIQTRVSELWDLLGLLGNGAEFVLGDSLSPWREVSSAVELITGRHQPVDTREAWSWVSNPLPPGGENMLFSDIREDLAISHDRYTCPHSFEDLSYLMQEMGLPSALERDFFRLNNPLVRHVVIRKRKELEDRGLLDRVGVHTHPLPGKEQLYASRFVSLGIPTNTPFEVAYEKAEEFSRLLRNRTQSAGFMKSLLLQRICSSFASGLNTARTMLARAFPEDADEQAAVQADHILSDMSNEEIACLQEIVTQLSRPEAVDSKLATVKWFLTAFQSEGRNWLEHGSIVFSQYFDTANWVAKELARAFPGEVVAVYAGVGKSGLYRDEAFNAVERESIKKAVKERRIRLVVATDAACEGLNLQTLGTLINVDLPWNPSRLEQRLGRIKRFGQVRKNVDMLNLVYANTQDERIYKVLSNRLKDTYDIFGSLPDTIEDEWIQDEAHLQKRMDEYTHEREKATNAFSAKYKATVDPDANKWELCEKVLSRRDVIDKMSEPWR